MSFMIEVPTDSGDLLSVGDAGGATAVEPSLFGRCIFDVSRDFTFDAIMTDFSLLFAVKFSLVFHQTTFNPLCDGFIYDTEFSKNFLFLRVSLDFFLTFFPKINKHKTFHAEIFSINNPFYLDS